MTHTPTSATGAPPWSTTLIVSGAHRFGFDPLSIVTIGFQSLTGNLRPLIVPTTWPRSSGVTIAHSRGVPASWKRLATALQQLVAPWSVPCTWGFSATPEHSLGATLSPHIMHDAFGCPIRKGPVVASSNAVHLMPGVEYSSSREKA